MELYKIQRLRNYKNKLFLVRVINNTSGKGTFGLFSKKEEIMRILLEAKLEELDDQYSVLITQLPMNSFIDKADKNIKLLFDEL